MRHPATSSPYEASLEPAPLRALGRSLSALVPGESAVVEGVSTASPIGRRLLDLGFRPGTLLRVIRRAPLGDPTTYEVRGSRFCLRRSEAERIQVRDVREQDA